MRATPDKLPTGVPACAGVLLRDGDGRLLLTLGDRDRWNTDEQGRTLIPLSGVGGGVDAGETHEQAALRETREEVGLKAQLIHSAVTFVRDGEQVSRQAMARTAPLLYARVQLADGTPFAEGLPAGDVLHVAMFLATATGQPQALDVPGLVWVTYEELKELTREGSLPASELAIVGEQLPADARVFLPPEGMEALYAQLMIADRCVCP